MRQIVDGDMTDLVVAPDAVPDNKIRAAEKEGAVETPEYDRMFNCQTGN